VVEVGSEEKSNSSLIRGSAASNGPDESGNGAADWAFLADNMHNGRSA
jgi:hypothetical protein